MDLPDTTVSSDLHSAFSSLREQLSVQIIGQAALLDRLMVALLADGHLLVEGAPGLAKTTAVKALATRLQGDFHRIQFTPDLLPADLTGTEIFRPQDARFEFQPGPLFHNLLLADEINRAPAKVQSALLEAMGGRQVTVGRVTYPLPQLFLVMATQNPIEQAGVYPLPEAQLDRFMLKCKVGYPDQEAEFRVMAETTCEKARRFPPFSTLVTFWRSARWCVRSTSRKALAAGSTSWSEQRGPVLMPWTLSRSGCVLGQAPAQVKP